MNQRMHKLEPVVMAAGIALAFILWYIMFLKPPANFWLLMTASTSFLAAVSMLLNFPPIAKEELTGRLFWTGILAAAGLYFIFLIGNTVSEWIIPGKAEQLSIIYGKKELLSKWQIAVLLFFPIGFGEEIFWRGLVQRVASARFGWRNGFLITLFFYTAVHVATMNIMLIGAAFFAGLFWGLLYWRTNSLLPCLISHMLWDPLVMVIAPIQ